LGRVQAVISIVLIKQISVEASVLYRFQ
jgi:hypothetical protein